MILGFLLFGNKEKKKRKKLLSTIKKLQEEGIGDAKRLKRIAIDIDEEVPLKRDDREYIRSLIDEMNKDSDKTESQTLPSQDTETPEEKEMLQYDKKEPDNDNSDIEKPDELAKSLQHNTVDDYQKKRFHASSIDNESHDDVSEDGEIIRIPPKLRDTGDVEYESKHTMNGDSDINEDDLIADEPYHSTQRRSKFSERQEPDSDRLQGSLSEVNKTISGRRAELDRLTEHIKLIEEDAKNLSVDIQIAQKYRADKLRSRYNALSRSVAHAKNTTNEIVNDLIATKRYLDSLDRQLSNLKEQIYEIEEGRNDKTDDSRE